MEAATRSAASFSQLLPDGGMLHGQGQRRGKPARPAAVAGSPSPLNTARRGPLFCRCGKELPRTEFLRTGWHFDTASSQPQSSHPAPTRAEGRAGDAGRKHRGSIGATARERRQVRAAASAVQGVATETGGRGLEEVRRRFEALPDGKSKYRLLLQYAAGLPRLGEGDKTADNRVMGCTAQVGRTRSRRGFFGPPMILGQY